MVAADAPQPGDLDLVAGLKLAEQLVECRAGGEFAGLLLDDDVVRGHAGAYEGVELALRRFTARRPRHPDPLTSSPTG